MRRLELISKHFFLENAPIQNFRLKRARITKKFTARDLAKNVGISKRLYFAIEGIRSYPSKKVKNKIAKTLNKNPEYLFPERLRQYAYELYRKLKSKDVLDNLKRVEFDFKQIQDPVNYEQIADQEQDSVNLNSRIMKLLETLKYKEGEIIKDRFGFRASYSLREAAEKYHVCPQRIRQIEAKAIRKLQYPFRASSLIGFYKD